MAQIMVLPLKRRNLTRKDRPPPLSVSSSCELQRINPEQVARQLSIPFLFSAPSHRTEALPQAGQAMSNGTLAILVSTVSQSGDSRLRQARQGDQCYCSCHPPACTAAVSLTPPGTEISPRREAVNKHRDRHALPKGNIFI